MNILIVFCNLNSDLNILIPVFIFVELLPYKGIVLILQKTYITPIFRFKSAYKLSYWLVQCSEIFEKLHEISLKLVF